MVAVTVSFNSEQIQGMLAAVEDCAQDMRVPLRRSSVVIRNEITRIFEAEGPPGRPWWPISRDALIARLRRSRSAYRALSRDIRATERTLSATPGSNSDPIRAGLIDRLHDLRARRKKMIDQWLAGKHQILQDTGRLRRSITASSEAVEGSVRHLTKRDLFIGTDLEYAGTHQYGLRGVPKRPFVVPTQRMVKDVAQVFRHWAVERLIASAKEWAKQ